MCDRRTADRQDVDDRIRAGGDAASVVIDAAARYREFVESDLLALPVTDGDGQRVVGLVRRSDVATAYLRQLHGKKEE